MTSSHEFESWRVGRVDAPVVLVARGAAPVAAEQKVALEPQEEIASPSVTSPQSFGSESLAVRHGY